MERVKTTIVNNNRLIFSGDEKKKTAQTFPLVEGFSRPHPPTLQWDVLLYDDEARKKKVFLQPPFHHRASFGQNKLMYLSETIKVRTGRQPTSLIFSSFINIFIPIL